MSGHCYMEVNQSKREADPLPANPPAAHLYIFTLSHTDFLFLSLQIFYGALKFYLHAEANPIRHCTTCVCARACVRERERVSSSNQLTNHLTRYSFNIHFNIIVPSTPPSPKWSPISWLSKSDFPINSSRRPNVLHTCSNTHSAERAPPHFIVIMVLGEGQAL